MIKSFKVYYGNQLSSPLTYLEKQVDGAVKEDFLKKMIPVLYHKLLGPGAINRREERIIFRAGCLLLGGKEMARLFIMHIASAFSEGRGSRGSRWPR